MLPGMNGGDVRGGGRPSLFGMTMAVNNATTKNDFGVRAIGVASLSAKQLRANPHNPRKLFDREDLHVLRESIWRVGILGSPHGVQGKEHRQLCNS